MATIVTIDVRFVSNSFNKFGDVNFIVSRASRSRKCFRSCIGEDVGMRCEARFVVSFSCQAQQKWQSAAVTPNTNDISLAMAAGSEAREGARCSRAGF